MLPPDCRPAAPRYVFVIARVTNHIRGRLPATVPAAAAIEDVAGSDNHADLVLRFIAQDFSERTAAAYSCSPPPIQMRSLSSPTHSLILRRLPGDSKRGHETLLERHLRRIGRAPFHERAA